MVTLVSSVSEPNDRAVRLLEDALERVRTGESIAIAIVEVRRGRTVGTSWAESSNGAYHLLNSGAARLAYRLASQNDD